MMAPLNVSKHALLPKVTLNSKGSTSLTHLQQWPNLLHFVYFLLLHPPKSGSSSFKMLTMPSYMGTFLKKFIWNPSPSLKLPSSKQMCKLQRSLYGLK